MDGKCLALRSTYTIDSLDFLGGLSGSCCTLANMQPQPPHPEDLGSYLRSLRHSRGLGLREAALSLKVNAGHLSKLERGIGVPPGGELILRLAQFYGVAVEELLRWARSRTADTVAADKKVAREIAAFYRLAAGRTQQERLEMLLGALEKLELSPEERKRWATELRALAEDQGPELLRLGAGRSWLFDPRSAPRQLRAQTIEAAALRVLARAFGTIDAYRPPTPIDKLVEYGNPPISLEVLTTEDSRGALLSDGTPAVLGMTHFGTHGTPTIAIHESLFDSTDAVTRRRANFTLGHEYYHAIEHLPRMQGLISRSVLNRNNVCSQSRNTRRLTTVEDWREWQANVFAAAILMPAAAVTSAFRAAFDTDAIVVESSDLDATANAFAREPFHRDNGTISSLVDLFDVNPLAMAIRLKTLGLVTT